MQHVLRSVASKIDTFVLSYFRIYFISYLRTKVLSKVLSYESTSVLYVRCTLRKYFRTFVQFVLPEVRKYFRTSVLPCMCIYSFVCSKLLLSYLRTTVSYEGMSFRTKVFYTCTLYESTFLQFIDLLACTLGNPYVYCTRVQLYTYTHTHTCV